jgi:hypothetical protein
MSKLLSRFLNEEKMKAFNLIAERYYDLNFGTMTKSEIDILMFSILIDHLQSNKIEFSDYSLSKDLGISQSKVRGLRISQQLKYPKKLNWQEEFARSIDNAVFDEKTSTMKVSVSDPNVLLEIKNVIENSGGYVEVQLNSKLLQVRVEHFVHLLIVLQNSENENQILKRINNSVKKYKKMEEDITKENLGELLKNEGLDVIVEVLSDSPKQV